MRKITFIIILLALILITLFSAALVCGQCGSQIRDEDKIDVDRDAETIPTDPESVAEQQREDSLQTPQGAPTIYLEIIMGPTYAPANDVCFYRVQAVVSGDPQPTIEWSRDDSYGAWGKDVAQVNISSRDQTYTLTAKAVNAEGTAEDSITFGWECEQ